MDVLDLQPSVEENRELWNNDRPNWDRYTGWTIQHVASGRYLGIKKGWTGGFFLVATPSDSCQWVFTQPTRDHYRPPFPNEIPGYTLRRGGFYGRFYGVCLMATQAIGSEGCLCSWSTGKKSDGHWSRMNLVTWKDPENPSKFCVGLARETFAAATQPGLLAVDLKGTVQLSYVRVNDHSPLSIAHSRASSLRFVPVTLKPQPIVTSPPPPLPPAEPEEESLIFQQQVPWRPLYSLGVGVDLMTFDTRMSAFGNSIRTTVDDAGGASMRTQSFAATTATSDKALKHSGPDILCNANAWPYIPLEARFNFSSTSSKQSLSSEKVVTFAYVQVIESGETRCVADANLDSASQNALKGKAGMSAFIKQYGSHYVSRATLGSCLTIHFVLTRTQQKQSKNSQSLFDFGVRYLTAGFGAAWASKLRTDLAKEHFNLQIFWTAVGVSKGAKGLSTAVSPEDIPALIQWFQGNTEPTPIFATLDTYAKVAPSFAKAHFAEQKAPLRLMPWFLQPAAKIEVPEAASGQSKTVKA